MRKLLFYLRFLAAAVLFWTAVQCWSAGTAQTGIHIFLSAPIDLPAAQTLQLREMEQEEALRFCLWSQPGETVLTCPETDRRASASVTAAFGDAELLAPNGGILNWWEDGCLLAKETAEDLFGTAALGEQTLECTGKTYTALALYPSLRPGILRPAKPGDTFTALVVEGDAAEGENFLLRHGLAGEVMDLSLLKSLTGLLILLMPLLLTIDLTRALLSPWQEASLRGKLLRAAAVAALMGAFCLLCAHFFTLPAGTVPPKWSDFSFWSAWWEKQKGNFLRLLTSPLGENQLQMTVDMVKSMVTSLLGAALLPRIKKRERAWSHEDPDDRG